MKISRKNWFKCKFGIHDGYNHDSWRPPNNDNGYLDALRILTSLGAVFAGIGSMVGFLVLCRTGNPIMLSIALPVALLSGYIFSRTFAPVCDATCVKCSKHIFDYSKRTYRLRSKEDKLAFLKEFKEERAEALKADFEKSRLEALDTYIDEL